MHYRTGESQHASKLTFCASEPTERPIRDRVRAIRNSGRDLRIPRVKNMGLDDMKRDTADEKKSRPVRVPTSPNQYVALV